MIERKNDMAAQKYCDLDWDKRPISRTLRLTFVHKQMVQLWANQFLEINWNFHGIIRTGVCTKSQQQQLHTDFLGSIVKKISRIF